MRNLSLFLLFTIPLFSAEAEAAVLSYKAWKSRRVFEAKSVVKQFKDELKVVLKTNDTSKVETQKVRVEQAEINVDIANELGPTDYFVLYLAKNFSGNQKAVREAVSKMTSNEVAEILMGYQKKLLDQNLAPETGATPAHLLVPLFRTNQNAFHAPDSKN
jgi:hypothetical protein